MANIPKVPKIPKKASESKASKGFIYFLIGLALLFGIYSLNDGDKSNIERVPISQVVQEVKQDQVKKIQDDKGNLTVELRDGKKQKTQIGSGQSVTTLLKDYGVDPAKVETLDVVESTDASMWVNIILSILPFAVIGFFLYFMMKQAQGSNNQAMMFGKSKARLFGPDKKKVTFADVAGVEEAKQELNEIVDFLKNPKKFTDLGAKIPKGVLMVGLPGTGKTLLSRAVAGEAGVPFFSISGSEFVEMFVGVGASRVRDLFQRAKKNAPCIIFIDEIDAVGRQRGAGLGGSHDEREQTLNQILVEMDGFEQDTNVIVMAATNRPDVLDPALLRPGRFDRRVVLDAPDLKSRVSILEVHAKGKPLEKDVDLEEIAKHTPGFSGADLANLVNEAAILAGRRNLKKVSQSELTEAVEKVLLGPERKSHILSPKEKEITAYHEAGHAIVGHLLPHCDKVHKVSVVSRGQAGGYTWSIPDEDKYMHSKVDFEDQIAMMLGGRIAEKVIYGADNVTTGAENDLRQATKLARKMVVEYGMSEKMGARVFGHKEEMVFLGRELGEHTKDYSEATANKIDDEVTRIIGEGIRKAEKIIKDHTEKLKTISKELLEKEILNAAEFEKIMGGPKKVAA
ncbi:TPA: cell division protein FtsH [candidate division CPR2 bacterium]|uniref:ATP-dependent zinc metalloprotease FtsH n=1 Tax=candidate division CPR2 bacterium GW2011_GWC1_41_48 TaxID=1618344 RepID=A0A0G0W8I2_UNCC2|nr:MAG: ATP-dependent zinc metalloprotease FtsH [candidate division CPR2 bacterium GW2011_GWC2_39_35]KKR29095.1 MAG: ATP-dependent zinc metalloprotease FtsH [candidate division CPR2 bacterium GW2011_GWD2_39_7]KKS09290.1 MAG: ATP-dependent zinc metalloprotease FtsH [candidate division CPR2 bacterium GW2011_GWC1_41_48]OGB70582.1 MAG: cell division protein FtsH [candidate division CPR2 bacterium GWD2_39_7]HBG82047.1 cell division protein FtsH [candidate division CPR2 bacterium]